MDWLVTIMVKTFAQHSACRAHQGIVTSIANAEPAGFFCITRKRLRSILARGLDAIAPKLPDECDCNELNCTHERWLTCARRLGGGAR